MQINLLKIISSSIRFQRNWIVYCLLFVITVQSIAPEVVLCFGNCDDTEVDFCLKKKCCSFLESTGQLLHGFDCKAQQPLDDSCKKCVEIPLFKSLNQKNSTKENPVNLLALALYTSSCFFVSYIAKSSTKRNSPLTTGNTSCLSSPQNVILQI